MCKNIKLRIRRATTRGIAFFPFVLREPFKYFSEEEKLGTTVLKMFAEIFYFFRIT